LPRPEDRFEPRMPEPERQARYAGWQEAVARVMLRSPADLSRALGAPGAVQS